LVAGEAVVPKGLKIVSFKTSRPAQAISGSEVGALIWTDVRNDIKECDPDSIALDSSGISEEIKNIKSPVAY